MSGNDKIDDDSVSSLPHGAQLAWGLVKPSTRGPKGELSVGKIVEAAVGIADREGLSAVSMNRVASSLGFTTMSLYRYIKSKDDLLMLMTEAVCDIQMPEESEGKGWRERLREYVETCIRLMRAHPWFTDVPIMGVPITPNNLKMVDWPLRILRDLPLSEYEKMSTVLLISGYSRFYGVMMRDMDRAIESGANPDSFSGLMYGGALRQLVTPERYPALYPIVAAGVYTEDDGNKEEAQNDFDFGLERILDGIELHVSRATS
ncbi:TetR/AcrR family transcriptional regulator [Cohnella hashimotonis]|uniref:TetR/AcrR family transcriptional regulator n=1 Tax=Cohnella hashimotonis TaxID=2826895 RepID=A0ABT6TJD9_9BACL|nr:TetR/AcrR family transcriptional regulator [Cohnella hashimotonis]MDI4646844.1 TetR/AcrR family transcriptional regulator [Cohnella hashimotonis]